MFVYYKFIACSFFLTGIIAHPVLAQICDPDDPTTALIDLGTGTYKTFEGGLYAGGTNNRPPAHDAAGLAIANDIEPLNSTGTPDVNGVVVLMSIGYSNHTHEWASGANGDPGSIVNTFTSKALDQQTLGVIHPKVRFVDGAQGGQAAGDWAATPLNPQTLPWSTAMNRLNVAGLSRFQVQIVCVRIANPNPNQCIASDGSTLGDAGLLVTEAADIARNLQDAFPNIKIAYFMGREYGGYATTGLNPEPFAYEGGFAVKWLIDAQIHQSGAFGNLNFDSAVGPVVSPWLSWGPQLWANGTTPNGQGLFWLVEDFQSSDGTHPSGSGVDKAGTVILDFFLNETTAQPWFLAAQPCPADCAQPGNGVVNVADLLQVLADWGGPGTCDLDGNGVTEVTDLLNILGAWGACP